MRPDAPVPRASNSSSRRSRSTLRIAVAYGAHSTLPWWLVATARSVTRGGRSGWPSGWTRLVGDYLKGRRELKRVFLLIDARHCIKPNDEETMALLDEVAVSYQVVLTKADKPKASELAAIQGKVAAALAKHPAAYPEILATSARLGSGIPELRAAVARLAPNAVVS